MEFFNCKQYIGVSFILLLIGVINLVNNTWINLLPSNIPVLVFLVLAWVWGIFTVILAIKMLFSKGDVKKSGKTKQDVFSVIDNIFVCNHYVGLSFLVVIIHGSISFCLGSNICPMQLVDIAYLLYYGVFLSLVYIVWGIFTVIMTFKQFVRNE